MPRISESRTTAHLVVFACLVVIAAGLKAAEELITPILVSLFFSVLCIPPMERLKKRGVPEGVAITIVMLGATITLLGVSMIITRSLAGFEAQIPFYRAALDERFASVFAWLSEIGVEASADTISEKATSGALLNLVRDVAAQLLNALSQIFLVILTIVFMLLEASSIPTKLRLAMGRPDADLSTWGAAMQQVQKYVAIKAFVSLVTALLAVILLYIVDVDFPLLWGLIAFLFNFIPNIGSVIAALPPMLLALVQFGFSSAIFVGIGYLGINTIMGNVVEPRLMGRRLGLSTLVVFLSLVFWNWIWGPVGMVLSVPLTVIVKIVMEHSDSFRGVAVMLGPDQPESPVEFEALAERLEAEVDRQATILQDPEESDDTPDSDQKERAP